MARIRPAAVAGRFYPADPGELAELVDGLLGDVRPGQHGRRPVAAVAPHAGFQYSGAVAAESHAHLARWRHTISRVVLLGPAHFAPLDGMAVPAWDAFGTPLGTVEVDTDARTTAVGLPDVRVDDRPHGREHSLETHLPFLQRALAADVRVLPVLVGATAPAAVSALLSALLGNGGAIAVVSTDLSHYLDRRAAQQRDARTAAAIVAGDAAAVRPDDACGSRPLRGLLHHVTERGLAVEQLRLATSADSGGDPGRVVGYGAFLVHER